MEIAIRNVRDQVTDRLREEILTGQFTEGEHLRESPLSERFGVSRGPVRDAILQLTQEGLLTSQPNRGVRIAPSWDSTLKPLMANTRLEIESIALRELIKNGLRDVLIRELRENLQLYEMACIKEDMPLVVRLDLSFHRILLRECGHHGLEAVWLPLMGGLRLPYDRHDELIESKYEHDAILQAMEQNDESLAIAALKKNIMPKLT